MNLENSNIPEEYTDEISKAIYTAGYLGFGVDYLINCLQLEKKEVTKQFLDKEGRYYKIWAVGYYTAKTEVRNSVMQSALNGSTSSIDKVTRYFKETDDELNDIEDE
jgi:hypothetical protein